MRFQRRLVDAPATQKDEGFTLVELLVSMMVLGILFTIVIAATTTMYQDVRKQTTVTDGVEQGRKVVSALDKQVRYANAITDPVFTSPSAKQSIAWRSVTAQGAVQCTRMMYDPSAKTINERTWYVQTNADGTTTPTNVTAYHIVSGSIVPYGSVATGNSGAVSGLMFGVVFPNSATGVHTGLTTSFATLDGVGKRTSQLPTIVTFTAVNSPTASVSVCQEEM